MNEALTITGAILGLLGAMYSQHSAIKELKTDTVKSIDNLTSDMVAGFREVNNRLYKMQADIHIIDTTHGQRITALEVAVKS